MDIQEHQDHKVELMELIVLQTSQDPQELMQLADLLLMEDKEHQAQVLQLVPAMDKVVKLPPAEFMDNQALHNFQEVEQEPAEPTVLVQEQEQDQVLHMAKLLHPNFFQVAEYLEELHMELEAQLEHQAALLMEEQLAQVEAHMDQDQELLEQLSLMDLQLDQDLV